jgi:hypothetical protein
MRIGRPLQDSAAGSVLVSAARGDVRRIGYACCCAILLVCACSKPPESDPADTPAPADLRGSSLRASADAPSPTVGETEASAGSAPPPSTAVVGSVNGTTGNRLPTSGGKVTAEMTRDVPIQGVDDRSGAYAPVAFSKLAGFEYDIDMVEASIAAGQPDDEIPAEVRALNGRKVVASGFMVPIEMQGRETRTFLLMRNRMGCCFGMLLGINEWIHVRMEGDKTAQWINDVPINVYGTLEVGEDVRDGMVMSIYRMKGEDVVHRGGY